MCRNPPALLEQKDLESVLSQSRQIPKKKPVHVVYFDSVKIKGTQKGDVPIPHAGPVRADEDFLKVQEQHDPRLLRLL